MTIRSIAYGGGVQSTGLLVLAAQGLIDFPLALFANTGDDSEDPLTIEYVRDVATPYATKHGIELVTVQKTIGDQPDSILGKIERTAKSEVIPVRSTEGGPPLSRSCTVDFKIETMGRELRRRGAGPDNRATVALGISSDEATRAGRAARPWETLTYPLLGIPQAGLPAGYDRPLSRSNCERIIRDAGLPVPPKSSCWFCPFTSYDRWQDMRRDRPELFQRAVMVEQAITLKVGQPRYLTRFGVPLDVAITTGVDPLFAMDDEDLYSCTGGMCAT